MFGHQLCRHVPCLTLVELLPWSKLEAIFGGIRVLIVFKQTWLNIPRSVSSSSRAIRFVVLSILLPDLFDLCRSKAYSLHENDG